MLSFCLLPIRLSHLTEYVAHNGPFDGYLGFSQGGSLCHLLSLLARAGKLPFAPPRFLILLSCRLTRHTPHTEMVQAALTQPLDVPALVVCNGWDDHVEPEETEALLKSLRNPVAIKMDHIKGHKIARIGHEANALSKWRGFLQGIPQPRHDFCTSMRLLAVACCQDDGPEEHEKPSSAHAGGKQAPKALFM